MSGLRIGCEEEKDLTLVLENDKYPRNQKEQFPNYKFDTDVCKSIHFISSSPCGPQDCLYVMDDLCGYEYIIRATLSGKHLWVGEKMHRPG